MNSTFGQDRINDQACQTIAILSYALAVWMFRLSVGEFYRYGARGSSSRSGQLAERFVAEVKSGCVESVLVAWYADVRLEFFGAFRCRDMFGQFLFNTFCGGGRLLIDWSGWFVQLVQRFFGVVRWLCRQKNGGCNPEQRNV